MAGGVGSIGGCYAPDGHHGPVADQLRLTPPSDEEALAFLARQREAKFSHPYVGHTRNEPPPGYRVGRRRVELGSGRQIYVRAVEQLRAWRMFDLPWVQLYPTGARPTPGTTVALVATWAGLWSMDALRVVYAIDEHDRSGFATGTLPGHLLAGEERFMVEIDRAGRVSFDVYAFSRPDHPIASVGLPLLRHLQRKFRRESTRRFAKAVNAEKPDS